MSDPSADPYLWLEAVDGPEAVAWVEAQNAATLTAFGDARLAADQALALDLFNATDRIPVIGRRGAFVYNFWTDAEHPRGLWRRTTLDSYRQPAPDWDVLIDLDALCAAEQESWVWRGCATLPPTHERGLVSLSRGGADAVVVREFDLATRRFVDDGFVLPEGKTGAVWLDHETILVGTTLLGSTESGYARAIHRLRRGAALDQAEIVFEAGAGDMACWIARDHRADLTIVTRQIAFWESETHVSVNGRPLVRLDVPGDAGIDMRGDLVTLALRSDWLGHPAGSLLAIGLAAVLDGDRNFVALFTPAPRRILDSWTVFDDHVVLVVLDDLRGSLVVVAPADGWRPHVVPGLPEHATISADRLDAETDDLVVWTSDFLTPPTLWLGRRDSPPSVLKPGTPRFDAAGLCVARHDAIAKDGTRIPYFQIGPREARDAFTRLYAYGGFEVSLLPAYMPIVGALWLERGHVFVMACLRGGGEFGPAWHKAGQRERKRVAQDDFAAVAEDLVRRGVTRAARLAGEGGSNGGLLIGNMLTRHPTLFGALSCQIPLLDMARYTKLLAGASWIAEYGDPENAEDWAFLREISAYHLLRPGQPYPPVFFTTTRRDDRVHPGHARKMAAAMQALGYRAPLHEQSEGGHGSGADPAQRAFGLALGLAFIRHALGMP